MLRCDGGTSSSKLRKTKFPANARQTSSTQAEGSAQTLTRAGEGALQPPPSTHQEVNTRRDVSRAVKAPLRAHLQICVGSGCHESPIHPVIHPPIYPSIHPPTHLSTHSSTHQVIYSPPPFIRQSILYDGQSFKGTRAVACQCALMIHVLEAP